MKSDLYYNLSKRVDLTTYVTWVLFLYGMSLLTVHLAYNAVPVLLALPGLVLLVRKKLDFPPDLKRLFFIFLIFLTPIILSIVLGFSSLSYLDRPVRSLYYLLAAALIIKARPRFDLYLIGLALGQWALLILLLGQKLNKVDRPAIWSNPILVSEVAVGVFALLIAAWGWPRGWKKTIALLGQACCLPIILITETRGTFLALLGVLFFTFLFMVAWQMLRRRVAVILVAVLVIGSALVISQTSLGGRFYEMMTNTHNYQTGEKFSSAGIRLELWKESWLLGAERPLTGYGNLGRMPRVRELIFQGKLDSFVVGWGHSHSDYFEALATRGIPGLLSVLVLYLCPLVIFFRHRLSSPYLSLSGIALVIGYLISSLTDVPLRNGLTSMFLFMAITVTVAFLDIEAQSSNPE